VPSNVVMDQSAYITAIEGGGRCRSMICRDSLSWYNIISQLNGNGPLESERRHSGRPVE
jgi:hypothetical protein